MSLGRGDDAPLPDAHAWLAGTPADADAYPETPAV